MLFRSTAGTYTTEVKSVGIWWRVVITLTNNGTEITSNATIYPAVGSVLGTASSTATGSIIIDAAQLELNSSFATSFIETIAAEVTRNKTELTHSSSGIPINDYSGLLKFTPYAISQGTVFLLASYVDASNYTAILHNGTNLIARKRILGVNYDATIALTYVANTTYSIGWRFDSATGIDIFLDGTKGTNHTNVTDCQIGSTYQVGADGNGANHANGSYKKDAIYPKSLPDTELIRLAA